jgi:hypothetical protein
MADKDVRHGFLFPFRMGGTVELRHRRLFALIRYSKRYFDNRTQYKHRRRHDFRVCRENFVIESRRLRPVIGT